MTDTTEEHIITNRSFYRSYDVSWNIVRLEIRRAPLYASDDYGGGISSAMSIQEAGIDTGRFCEVLIE